MVFFQYILFLDEIRKNLKFIIILYQQIFRTQLQGQIIYILHWVFFSMCSGRVAKVLIHMWHPSCYSCYKPDDNSCIRKIPDCDYYKQNISVVICDIDIS